MKSLLLSATILAGLSVPAWAGINDLEIDAASNGSVGTLSIVQDDTNLGNQVSATSGGGSAMPVKGPWHTISINQSGGGNKLYGSIKAGSGSTTAALTASYTGAGNSHSLTIGATTAPVNPQLSITVAGASNTITDTLDGNALNYTLNITGSSNTLTNAIGATGAVTLSQAITGGNNTVSNTVTGATGFSHTLTVAGSGNAITNTVSGGGTTAITQDIQSDSNSITTNLDGGSQTASLSVDAASFVTYTQTSTGSGSNAAVTLSGVTGASALPAVVNLTQTAAAVGATATLSVNGGTFKMGTSLPGGVGVNVYQNSPGAILNASVAANANGYTANFTQ